MDDAAPPTRDRAQTGRPFSLTREWASESAARTAWAERLREPAGADELRGLVLSIRYLQLARSRRSKLVGALAEAVQHQSAWEDDIRHHLATLSPEDYTTISHAEQAALLAVTERILRRPRSGPAATPWTALGEADFVFVEANWLSFPVERLEEMCAVMFASSEGWTTAWALTMSASMAAAAWGRWDVAVQLVNDANTASDDPAARPLADFIVATLDAYGGEYPTGPLRATLSSIAALNAPISAAPIRYLLRFWPANWLARLAKDVDQAADRTFIAAVVAEALSAQAEDPEGARDAGVVSLAESLLDVDDDGLRGELADGLALLRAGDRH